MPNRPSAMKADEAAAGRTCPACLSQITPGDDIRNCEHCDLSYHAKCWVDHGGCKTLYCPLAPKVANESGGLPNAAEASDAKKQCPKCGEMIEAESLKCSSCGETFSPLLDIPEEELFDPTLIKKFRQEIHALAVVWIIFGVAFTRLAVFLSSSAGRDIGIVRDLAPMFLIFGVLWLASGAFACHKKRWAAYIGLLATYMSLAAYIGLVIIYVSFVESFASMDDHALKSYEYLTSFKVHGCVLLVMVLIIGQAHRTIGWANRMRELCIPLDTKPALKGRQEETPDPSFVEKVRQRTESLGRMWIYLGLIPAGLAMRQLIYPSTSRTSDSLSSSAIFSETMIGVLNTSHKIIVMAFSWEILGVLCIIIGALSHRRKMWAVNTGLVLSYILLAEDLVKLAKMFPPRDIYFLGPVIGLVILIIIISRTHRVISSVNKVRAHGISLERV